MILEAKRKAVEEEPVIIKLNEQLFLNIYSKNILNIILHHF